MKNIVTLALAGLILAGAGLFKARGAEDLRRQGQGIYEEYCAQCHRLNGQGLPNKFPALNKNPFVLGDPNPVIAMVLHGKKGELGRMPAWKDKLSDQEIGAAVTYIRQAWVNKAPAVTPAMVKAVRGK